MALPCLTPSDSTPQDDDTKKAQTALITTESEQASQYTEMLFVCIRERVNQLEPHRRDAILPKLNSSVKTYREGFEKTCEFIRRYEFTAYHPESLEDNECSYSQKNEPAIQYYAKLLTGRSKNEKWSRRVIEKTPIRIAEIGSGLGLSALSLVAHAVNVFEQENWTLEHPIELVLYDNNVKLNKPLEGIKQLVNRAFCQYFKINNCFIDITKSTMLKEQNYYNAVLCFNVINNLNPLNYVDTMQNIHRMMHKNALMFIVVPWGLKLHDKEHWFKVLMDQPAQKALFKRLKSKYWEQEIAEKSHQNEQQNKQIVGFTYIKI